MGVRKGPEYTACVRAHRIFVIDIYTAWVLRKLSLAIGSSRIPDISWDRIRVLSRGRTAAGQYVRVKKNREEFGSFVRELYDKRNVITEDDLASAPDRYLVKTSYSESLIQRLGLQPATVIYSLWSGYRTRKHNPDGYQKYERLEKMKDVDLVEIHTSGHATLEDLKAFAAAMKPKKIIPIHTEHAAGYPREFRNVHVLKDGEMHAI